MSAWVVSDAHVATLVDAMLLGPDPRRGHWSEIYSTAAEGFRLTPDDSAASLLGRLLLAENVASVAYLYPKLGDGLDDDFLSYTAPVSVPRRPVVELLKLVACYEYQSCEHSQWGASPARTLCTILREALVSRLPGYDAAPWGIP